MPIAATKPGFRSCFFRAKHDEVQEFSRRNFPAHYFSPTLRMVCSKKLQAKNTAPAVFAKRSRIIGDKLLESYERTFKKKATSYQVCSHR